MQVSAPKSTILLGAKGSSSSATIMKLARASVEDDILGIMVWYASGSYTFLFGDKPIIMVGPNAR